MVDRTRINRELLYLHPTLRERVTAVLAELRDVHQLRIELYEGRRTPERQDKLFARGKSQLQGNEGPHTAGHAADVVFRTEKGRWTWKVPAAHWRLVGEVARQHGLEWGGDWTTFRDLVHVQLADIDRTPWDDDPWPYRDEAQGPSAATATPSTRPDTGPVST